MNKSIAAPNTFGTLDKRLNSPPRLRVLLLIFIAAATVFSALPLLHYFRGGHLFDYKLWYDTGQQVLAGQEIFVFRSGKYDFMYPLPCALFFGGASLLGQGGLIFLLVAINSVAWFCSAKFSATLATGDRRVTNPWVYVVPSLLVIVYIWSTYHLGQPNLVLLALMLCAFVALRAEREIIAGSLIAVAAAIKAFPVIAIIYLLYRRYWTAAASLVVALILLLLILPAPFRGFERAWRDLEKWSAGMLKYSEAGVGQRPKRSYTWKNQSLVGVSNRLLRRVDADAGSAPHQPVYVNFADLKFSAVNAIIIGIALALGIAFIAVMPQRGMRMAESDAIEFTLLLLLADAAICDRNATCARWKRLCHFVVGLAGARLARSRLNLPTRRATLRQHILCHALALYRICFRAFALQERKAPAAACWQLRFGGLNSHDEEKLSYHQR